jgi:hypothetical protein
MKTLRAACYRTGDEGKADERRDACGGLGSSLSYTVPERGGDTYTITAGCYSSNSCSGVMGYEY